MSQIPSRSSIFRDKQKRDNKEQQKRGKDCTNTKNKQIGIGDKPFSDIKKGGKER
jgi:hypothetical protein